MEMSLLFALLPGVVHNVYYEISEYNTNLISGCATTATSTSVIITATTTKGNGSSSNFSSNVINISIAVATITTSIDKSDKNDKYYWYENNKNRYNLRFIDKLDSSHML